MSDLTEFLLARVAEDEAVANDAYGFILGSRWWEKTEHGRVYAGHWVPVVGVVSYDEPAADDADTVTHQGLGLDSLAHIARHDPARVLAECETKRRIVTTMQTANDHAWQDGASGPAIEFIAERVLRLLAQPHANHQDYREEWRV